MERILVVEDDGFFREVFQELLREEGIRGGYSRFRRRKVLEKLYNQDYHVVVTDLVMQGLSGLDLLSRVKQYDPAIEVILVTGHANVGRR